MKIQELKELVDQLAEQYPDHEVVGEADHLWGMNSPIREVELGFAKKHIDGDYYDYSELLTSDSAVPVIRIS